MFGNEHPLSIFDTILEKSVKSVASALSMFHCILIGLMIYICENDSSLFLIKIQP